MRRPILWLVMAGFATLGAPAYAVETAEPPLPERNPARRDAPAPDKTPELPEVAEAPAPERKPATRETAEVAVPDRKYKYPWMDAAPALERKPADADTAKASVPDRKPVSADTEVPPPQKKPAGSDTSNAPVPERKPVDGHTAKAAMPEETPAPEETTVPDEGAGPPPPEKKPVDSGAADGPAPEEKPNLPADQPAEPYQSPKVQAALAECAKLLEGVPIAYEQLPPIQRGACGAPAPILVKSIGEPAVAIEPPATMRCKLAVALETWVRTQVQPAAKAAFDAEVVKIRNISSYKCRNRYGGTNTKISEHAFANALDVSGFEMASGERVTVLDNWRRPPSPPPPPPLPEKKPPLPGVEAAGQVLPVKAVAATPPAPVTKVEVPLTPAQRKSVFLHDIHDDGCKTFNTVLGPDSNAAHRNHFHIDMKVRRYVKICE